MFSKTMKLTVIAGAAALAWSASASAALHAYCSYSADPLECVDNGTVTPTSVNPPSFGFSASPGGSTGTYYLDILTPNDLAAAASYSITGALSGTATLWSTTAWTSGTLGNYLGISASPNNPLSNLLGYTNTHGDAAATGYWVYQVNLGTQTLPGPSTTDGTAGPLTLTTPLPVGSGIVAFLDMGAGGIMATANSGTLFESGTPPTSVPEPGTLALLAGGLAMLAGRKRLGRALPIAH